MTSTVWRLVAPRLAGEEEQFGQPHIARGTWAVGEASPRLAALAVDGRCPRCGGPVPRPRRARPLVLEWPTTEHTRLGDFSWPGGSHLPAVTASLAHALEERFDGFEAWPVEVLPHRVKADGSPGKPLSRRFADEVAGLVELWPTRACRPDRERSTLSEIRPPCPQCGLDVLFWGDPVRSPAVMRANSGLTVLDGVEFWETGGWDAELGDLSRIRHPRQPGHGLFVTAQELGGADLFGLPDELKFLFCTDVVKRFVEERGCTNVAFLEAGEVV
jgi:hypothetical protein